MSSVVSPLPFRSVPIPGWPWFSIASDSMKAAMVPPTAIPALPTIGLFRNEADLRVLVTCPDAASRSWTIWSAASPSMLPFGSPSIDSLFAKAAPAGEAFSSSSGTEVWEVGQVEVRLALRVDAGDPDDRDRGVRGAEGRVAGVGRADQRR